MKNALYTLVGVMAGFALAGLLLFILRAPSGEPISLQPAPTKEPIAVHIIGAVPRPGLYEFAEGARVQDAINAAGGLLSSANVASINLAALLEDGQQLDIPYKSGEEPLAEDSGGGEDDLNLPGGTEEPTDTGGSEDDLININTASLEELDSLPGIGPSIAQRIIDYRDENGPFASIEDLLNVSGIGPSTFDQIKDLITV
ncbi:MAG: ComEA family DNA-binding protein [Anaerolineales bacterium]|jgi:competence protein ComEA|nr:ComEA family DNA-binding protein [Chloroflexota bacterium]MBK6645694.1 ComEA family DNA-binding protein [Anaerolineales bacterium]MCC6986855.1 ComEA family DNA-binding protein [Anaerolineales bacterium]